MQEPTLLTFLPRGRRAVMTAGLAAAAWGVARSDPGPTTHGRGLLILVLLVIGSLAWITWAWLRTRDEVMLAIVTVFAVSGGLLTAAAPNGPSSAFAFVAVVSAGVRFSGARWVVVLTLAMLALACGAIAYDESATGALAYCAGMAAATLGGKARRTSIVRGEEAQLLLAQIQRSTEEQKRAAALDERARIAREIHDVLAHSLAGLTIDLEATRMLVEQGADQAKVLARVDRAHSLAREGLLETRRAVEALRGDSVRAGEQLAALVDEFRESTGARATLGVTGSLDDLPPDAALATIRVTQEALTNVRKHAPGAGVEVQVERGADAVTLRVTNEPPTTGSAPTELGASGGGYGLRGMRERAEMLGGQLQAAPTGGGWQVEMRIPLGAEQAA